jgi:uncharacterized protein YdeI (YjbR/CyaY-like superfamily)
MPTGIRSEDPAVAAYIARQAAFAQPFLVGFRAAVHAVLPGALESIKWSAPCWEQDGLLVGIAAFKAHVRIRFFREQELSDVDGGRFASLLGKLQRLEDGDTLPAPRTLKPLLVRAAALNTEARPAPRPSREKAPVVTPEDLAAALGRTRGLLARFEAQSPSHRREYVEWIDEARKPETRARRIAQAAEWIAEGKHRNWQYMETGR